MDWTEVLAIPEENKRARLAAELLASDAYGSTAERVQAFVEQLARLSLAVALQGLLEAKTVAVANQERKQWIDRWKTALPAAANVPDALFGSTP